MGTIFATGAGALTSTIGSGTTTAALTGTVVATGATAVAVVVGAVVVIGAVAIGFVAHSFVTMLSERPTSSRTLPAVVLEEEALKDTEQIFSETLRRRSTLKIKPASESLPTTPHSSPEPGRRSPFSKHDKGMNNKIKEADARIRREAWEELGLDAENYVNFEFCGPVNAGKSRLINALRQVKEGEPGYAKTDDNECTKKIEPFKFPNEPMHLVLWDIPGGGSAEYPSKTYFMNNKLYAFDCLIFVMGSYVSEVQQIFATMAKEYNVPFVFVRSKCDQDLRQKALDAKCAVANVKEIFLANAHAAIDRAMKKCAPQLDKVEAFCISATVFEDSQYEEFVLEEEKLTQYIAENTCKDRYCKNRKMS